MLLVQDVFSDAGGKLQCASELEMYICAMGMVQMHICVMGMVQMREKVFSSCVTAGGTSVAVVCCSSLLQ
jgi:hypothetical protein